MLSKGQGCEPDQAKARSWFHKAAAQGLKQARNAVRNQNRDAPENLPESDAVGPSIVSKNFAEPEVQTAAAPTPIGKKPKENPTHHASDPVIGVEKSTQATFRSPKPLPFRGKASDQAVAGKSAELPSEQKNSADPTPGTSVLASNLPPAVRISDGAKAGSPPHQISAGPTSIGSESKESQARWERELMIGLEKSIQASSPTPLKPSESASPGPSAQQAGPPDFEGGMLSGTTGPTRIQTNNGEIAVRPASECDVDLERAHKATIQSPKFLPFRDKASERVAIGNSSELLSEEKSPAETTRVASVNSNPYQHPQLSKLQPASPIADGVRAISPPQLSPKPDQAAAAIQSDPLATELTPKEIMLRAIAEMRATQQRFRHATSSRPAVEKEGQPASNGDAHIGPKSGSSSREITAPPRDIAPQGEQRVQVGFLHKPGTLETGPQKTNAPSLIGSPLQQGLHPSATPCTSGTPPRTFHLHSGRHVVADTAAHSSASPIINSNPGKSNSERWLSELLRELDEIKK